MVSCKIRYHRHFIYTSVNNQINMSLQQKAIIGVKWASASSGIVVGLQTFQFAVLARLLNAKDFGLMAMLIVVLELAYTFSDIGISNAIIQRQEISREHLSSLYWANVLAGFVVFLLVFLSTPLIIWFYKEERLAPLIVWVALNFLIAPFGQQFQYLFQKELQFDRLFIVDIAGSSIGVLTAIIVAIADGGVYALILGFLSNTATRALFLFILGYSIWRPSLHFRVTDLHDYLRFGLYQMGERTVNNLSANMDLLMIGRFLGPEVLGVYRLACQLVIAPLKRINPILIRVAFPVFAKRQHDNQALQKGYLEIIKFLATIIFPSLVGLVAIAPIFVPILYGPGWDTVPHLVQILALLGICKSLSNPTGSVYLAKGRADIGFAWNVFVAVLNTLIFWYITPWGIRFVAWSYTLLGAFYLLVLNCWLIPKIINLHAIDFIHTLTTPAIISLAMGATLYFFRQGLASIEIGYITTCILLTIVGVTTYGLLLWCTDKAYIRELKIRFFSNINKK